MAKKAATHADKRQADKKPAKHVKAKSARAPADKRTDATRQAKPAVQVVKTKVIADLPTVTSANLQALRSRLQTGAGKRGRAVSGKAVPSKESNALAAALEKLEAAYRELLQR